MSQSRKTRGGLINYLKKLVREPLFRQRREKPGKGKGSYRRKPKHTGG
jgi:alternative ribosome-rescue factor